MNNKPMSGSEVARHLGITRQTVSATTKRALRKMYSYILVSKINDNAFDAMLTLMTICNIDNGSMEDVSAFVSLFPKKIQEQVKGASPR